MPLYFRVADRREVSAAEALDARGVLRHGYGQRVPAHLRDGAPRFTDGRSFWDHHRDALVVTDARAIGGLEGCKPGFRVSDGPINPQAVADARAEYLYDLQNAWRLGDAAPPPDPDEDEDEDELPQGARERLTNATSDRRMVDVDAAAANHRHNMQRLYDAHARELSEAWRKR